MSKKIFCKKCHEEWGVTALINNVEWMCIKICSFVLEFPNQEFPRRIYKKWKDLPFTIDEASTDELLEYGAEETEDKEIDFELEWSLVTTFIDIILFRWRLLFIRTDGRSERKTTFYFLQTVQAVVKTS